MFEQFIRFVRELYGSNEFIPLHQPLFAGKEKVFLEKTIDSTFVSSVGQYVNDFEKRISEYTGVTHAVATVNGTAALHLALMVAGVESNDEVITQSLTFAATCAAIRYLNADPVFVDVEKPTLGMSPKALEIFLDTHAETGEGLCRNRITGKRIAACVPMNSFGHSVRIEEINAICSHYGISVIEDAAESLGSYYKGRHTGTFSPMAILSFNGNKIITTGGGGMFLTSDAQKAKLAKHLTTTAKIPHPWAYEHDAVGFNYRLPNLNAALGCAQLEMIDGFRTSKRRIAMQYQQWCNDMGIEFFKEPEHAESNYWLNVIILENQKTRDAFLEETNKAGVMTRPAWKPMHQLEMYKHCLRADLSVTEAMADRLVNIPSSVIKNDLK